MKDNLVPGHPYIPVVCSKTGRTIKVQRCAFVFKDPLTEVEITMIEKDGGLILSKVDRGFFISHFLDEADWARRLGIKITMTYPVLDHEYPYNLSKDKVYIN